MVEIDKSLIQLLRLLRDSQYCFEAVTPATHTLVAARPLLDTPTLRDIFGWNRPFRETDISPELFKCLQVARAVKRCGGGLRSLVRVASLGDDLFIHSAFPTDAADSVFFGPDTYRFARWVRSELKKRRTIGWLVDMGAGSGAGAIAAARCTSPRRSTLVDVNELALRYAAINAHVAGVDVETLLSDTIPRGCDTIIANPPYMIDHTGRTYRDGGSLYGGEVALRWCQQAMNALARGGRMLLYTGVAFSAKNSQLLSEVERLCAESGASLGIDHIDVDVFGDELANESYNDVERIGVVGLALTMPD